MADYHTKRVAWEATIQLEDDLDGDVTAALAALPPEPIKPPVEEAQVSDISLREWMATEQTPERKALWAIYDRDKAQWDAAQRAERSRILAPAKARYDAAYKAYDAALATLSSYPVTSLAHLGEKVEIIAGEFPGSEVPIEYFADVLADVRRLGGAA